MALFFVIKIWLLKNKRHAQHTFPKIQACLTVRSGQCNMMNTLNLKFLHAAPLERQFDTKDNLSLFEMMSKSDSQLP
jgi:hypothetical protein